jgi:plasmid maintenance system antidote protein VapI
MALQLKGNDLMSRTAATGNGNIGQMIDSIWHRIPENHHLFGFDPASMPSPHVHFLVLGQAIISHCEEHGAIITTTLESKDYSTWLRLVGAWAMYQRKKPTTRNVVAKLIGMDPSNLTNFINGKRALTANATTHFANLFDIEPFDLKPDLGANYARSAERRVAEKLESVSLKVESLRLEVQTLISKGLPVTDLMTKIDDLREAVRP